MEPGRSRASGSLNQQAASAKRQRCEAFLPIGKREFTVAKVAETFGHASQTETLCEFRYEKMLHTVGQKGEPTAAPD
ncbi:hypothetical protein RMSM_00931 [Rhodopirellula maiorica SM1]|uniref:Uncharacterized protein n=1 Tax=Rhodopirellula maiorica SM1 TaxID=1265738 RepID=M5S7I6_9BACT|nr:hypothetical protein RMSM_00931 [Rhodopirellula maiorica SM1]